MNPADTIVAPATPPGFSSRALVRISGPATDDLLEPILRPLPAPRRPVPCALDLGPRSLPVLAVRFERHHSYTGDAAAELQFPGNPILIERVVDRVIAAAPAGATVRLAGPGEFTARAFLSGRLTLAQAESVAAVVGARTSEELAAAGAVRSGAAGLLYERWRDELATLSALVEAGVDFTDQEDVVPIGADALARRLGAIAASLGSFLGPSPSGATSGSPVRIALVGAPNAGKSTLFNALLGRSRAVTSPAAGTTRDVLSEPIDLAGSAPGAPDAVLMDLPGLDERAAGALSVRIRERSIRAAAGADVLIHCDPSARFVRLPLPGTRAPVIRVRTMSDRPGARAVPSGALEVCALTGVGLGALLAAAADAAAGARSSGLARLLPRHRHAAIEILAAVRDARERLGPAPGPGGVASPELVSQALRRALDSAAELGGRIDPDEVLGRVFASFCIGK